MGIISKELLVGALPSQMKKTVSDDLVSGINKVIELDSEMREVYRDNILGYSHVMNTGRYKMEDYLNAVRFASYRMLGVGIGESYARTFPDRYQRLINEGASKKHISGFSSGYNKNKLVNLIMEHALVPTHVLNADLFQKAINVQVELMTDADVSPKVRSDAANSLLSHLKQPEKSKIELDININEGSMIDELRAATRGLAKAQLVGIARDDVEVSTILNSEVIVRRDD